MGVTAAPDDSPLGVAIRLKWNLSRGGGGMAAERDHGRGDRRAELRPAETGIDPLPVLKPTRAAACPA